MKKAIIASLFCIALSTAHAQEETDFKTDTIEMLKLTGTGAAFEAAIGQIGAGVPELKKAEYMTEAQASVQGLYGKIAELYMKEFTHAEVQELIAFYKSPLGKKLSEKQPVMMQQGMQLGQSWGAELMGIAQKYGQ